MRRFIITVLVPDFGKVQHITRARTEQAAKDRISRAYPKAELQFLIVAG